MISAALIVKNEEANLGRCLESLKGHVDELVIVDTGSTDSTVEIARGYGATVGFFPWNDSFACARNHALKLVTGDWVLSIDADEALCGDLRPLTRGKADAYALIVISNEEVGRVVRFARMVPGLQFVGRVHENLNVTDFKECDVILRHSGYTPEAMPGKHERNKRLLLMDIKDRPDAEYPRWQLARFALHHSEHEDAIRYGREAFDRATTENATTRAYVVMIRALHLAGRTDEALKMTEDAVSKGYGTAFIGYLRGLMLEASGQSDEARKWGAAMLERFGSPRLLEAAIKAEMPYVV